MKILITGALGHIGSKFIHSLSPGEFDEVRIIDNLSTLRYVSLFNLPSGINYNFIEDDILKADLDKYFQDIDVVIHLAAITDATSSFERSNDIEQVNLFGTEKVAKVCVKHNVKLLFPSTTSVYGTQEDIVDEECPVKDLKPQSPYAETKLKAEESLSRIGKEEGLKFITCRLGTIFGTSIGMRFHTAVNKFCWQAVMGLPITVWKTALDQKRPYLGINDVVGSIKFIIKKDLFDAKIYNIVSSNNTVREVIDCIKEFVPKLSIDLVESRIMNQLSYHVLSKRFESEGFKFNDNIREGIEDTIYLLKEAYSAAKPWPK